MQQANGNQVHPEDGTPRKAVHGTGQRGGGVGQKQDGLSCRERNPGKSQRKIPKESMKEANQ